MTMAFARSQYRQTEQKNIGVPDDPHEIVLVTLKELEKSLNILALSQRDGHPLGERPMTRAFTALYILQSSLDFERGGEVAASLFRVYEYCRAQVSKAFKREEDANLTQAAESITSLVDAWTRIGAGSSGTS